MNIPGYRLIAHSDLRHSTTRVYYNPELMTFMLMIDNMVVGPLVKHQLESLSHAAADVLTMRGTFNYLD